MQITMICLKAIGHKAIKDIKDGKKKKTTIN